MSETCKTCRFWVAGKDDGHDQEGVCRRYPPVVYGSGVDDDGNLYTKQRWPSVYSELWCGEYQHVVVSSASKS